MREQESTSRLQQPDGDPVLAAVLDSVECGILLFGPRGELRVANGRLAELLRVEISRLRELKDFEALVTCLAPQFAGSQELAVRWRQRFQSDEACWDELEMQRPVHKVMERFSRPVRDHRGQRLGRLEVYRDVTAQRLVETKLFHADRMVALGQLVSSIAHELNNPLTSILGYSQLLSRRGAVGRHDEVQQILEQAERASRIAKNLLLFARQGKSERVRVNLNEIAERTLALRSYDLRLGNIKMESALDPDLPPVLADAAQMQQVLLNLLLNAEQSLQQAGAKVESRPARIGLRTVRISPQRAAVEVTDNGSGIAPDDLPRVFDPFFTTKPAGLGTGLGLSIVYGIVREHGGEVWVESRPGQGATFRIELPIAASASADSAEPRQRALSLPSPADQRPAVAARPGRKRILVVEDEPTVARLIADVLSEEGHAVDTVLDSREGLKQIAQRDYDLVICDLRMPHLDGRAFYAELLRLESPLARRLIFVTGDILTRHTLDFLEKSGLPYLAKPFLVEELKDAMHGALAAEKTVASEEPPQRAGHWLPHLVRKQ